jgi:hypothetical protein
MVEYSETNYQTITKLSESFEASPLMLPKPPSKINVLPKRRDLLTLGCPLLDAGRLCHPAPSWLCCMPSDPCLLCLQVHIQSLLHKIEGHRKLAKMLQKLPYSNHGDGRQHQKLVFGGLLKRDTRNNLTPGLPQFCFSVPEQPRNGCINKEKCF